MVSEPVTPYAMPGTQPLVPEELETMSIEEARKMTLAAIRDEYAKP